MRTDKFALVCALLVLSILEPITARKGFNSGGGRGRSGGHSYPQSGGLSGSGGHHGYPSSGGLSGSGGGSHGYPASGGLSGGGSHGYPPRGGVSGGSHAYPSSGGSHGYPSSGGSHSYPSSGGLSGSGSSNSHGYPAGNRLSGNTGSQSTTNVHHHYHYTPPKEIRYSPVHGGVAQSYPVYHGSPPTYVYKYKDSGSKYGTLLTGLALLNLGVLAGGTAAYVATHNHGSSQSQYTNYKPQAGEYCKFGVKKDNGDYEETRIDCQLISSFIMQADQAQPQSGGANKTVVTTSVTNITTVNMTNGVPEHPPMNTTKLGDQLYQIMPNGTLIPVNETVLNMTANANGVASSVVTTVTNTTTVTDALDVKGQPIAVTPGMQCFVIRHTPVNDMRKTVPCGLLQTYAEKSIKPNSAARNAPAFTILAVVLAAFVMH